MRVIKVSMYKNGMLRTIRYQEIEKSGYAHAHSNTIVTLQ